MNLKQMVNGENSEDRARFEDRLESKRGECKDIIILARREQDPFKSHTVLNALQGICPSDLSFSPFSATPMNSPSTSRFVS